jgi:hypothetical protein
MRTPLLAALALAPALAAADSVPAGKAVVTESLAVVNLEELPEYALLQYPVVCDLQSGLPYGVAPDPSLDDLLDYAVLLPGEEQWVAPCGEPRLYLLRRDQWTVGEELLAPTREPLDGANLRAIAELDAMSGAARWRFFREDPRVVRVDHPPLTSRTTVERTQPLRRVHDLLRLTRAGAGVVARCERVVYTYADDTSETLPCADGRRPPPSGRGQPPEPPPSGRPTWVWLGLAGALVVLAALRLRRTSGSA